MNNIILEGCDGTGKTSIAGIISRLIDNRYTVIHLDAPKNFEDGKKLYVNMLAELWNKDNLIYDRGHISEIIYAPIFRDYYPYYMQAFESLLPSNTILVILTANTDKLIERYDGKMIKIDHLEKINNAYKKYFEISTIKQKYLVDTSNIDVGEAAWRIWHYAFDTYPSIINDKMEY